MANVFISYRRDDSAGYAGRLRESLEHRLGHAHVFRDVDTIAPGQDFVDAIESRLRACDVMLVVIGREWVDARLSSGARRLDDPHDFVRLEVAAGLAKPGVLVIPALVEGVSMPAAAELPEQLHALARRHAVSLRDETWDTDVDRLVAVIDRISSSRTTGATWLARVPRWRLLAGVALAALAVAVAGFWLTRERPSTSVPRVTVEDRRPYTIDVPRIAEVAFDELVVTLVSGNVIPRGDDHELRLRIRMSNGGSVPANFWDQGFRVVVGSQIWPATGGLNDVVPGHTLTYGVVSFRVPPQTRGAVLRLLQGTKVVDMPIDIGPTGRPPVDEHAVIEDSLSQAMLRRLTHTPTPTPLIDTGDVTVTMLGGTSRRFVNTLRVKLSLRLENRSRYPIYSGDVLVRAEVDGTTIAPLIPPDNVVEAGATGSADVIFDVPPLATRAVITARAGGHANRIDLVLTRTP